MNSTIDFSKSFRMAMAHNDITATKIAADSKIDLKTKQSVSKITTGSYSVSMDAAERYAAYFNVPFMTFVDWGLDKSIKE